MEDPKTKQATPKKSLLGESLAGAGGTAAVVVAFLWLGERGIALTPVFWGMTLSCGLLCALLVFYSVQPRSLEQDLKEDINKGEVGDYYLVGLPCLVLGTFTVAAYFGWKLYGDGFLIAPQSDRPVVWMMYCLDNVVRAVALDFAEVYRLNLSNIDHAPRFWPSTFVFLFRTTLSIALASVLIRSVATIRSKPVEAGEKDEPIEPGAG